MRLIAADSRVLHQWRVSIEEIWPRSIPSPGRRSHDWETLVHGAVLLPNGDAVFNFENSGIVRVDWCSRVRWKLPERTHHSIFVAPDGNLWVPSRRLRTKRASEFPHVPAPFQEDTVLEISPDGKVLREISILGAIFRSGYQGVLFATGAHGPGAQVPLDHDFTHLNDVEILPPAIAADFPLFSAGDILVSLRNVDLLLVVDPETERIKWSFTGPFLRQHDPDFMPGGRISVFDNHRDNTNGRILGGSRIVSVDPASGRVSTVYGGTKDAFFYTERMGNDQYLPNGNILITESEAGRVFEVTPDGSVVWSFVNRWGKDAVAVVTSAMRYPETFVSGEKCQ
jgi:hypothetical protein